MSDGPIVHVYYGPDHEIAAFCDSINREPVLSYRATNTTGAMVDGRPLPDGWVLTTADGEEWIVGAWEIDGVDDAVVKAQQHLGG